MEEVAVTGQAEVFNPAETRIQTTIRTETLQELPLQGATSWASSPSGPGITGHGAVGGGPRRTLRTTFDREDGGGQRKRRNYRRQQFTLDGLNVTSNSCGVQPVPE